MIYTIFILPLLQIITGYLMYKYPPKKINYFVGYRTSKSMKNEKIWDFANKYCGSLWIKMGIILLVITTILSILIYLKVINFTENVLIIIMFFQVTIMLLSVIITEYKIKNYK